MMLQFNVPKLACSACVKAVTEAFMAIDPNATVEADTKTKVVSIETQATSADIKKALASIGYPAA